MGQQQLLLVILVTIIVGIATVVAINTFSSAADSANLDAVRQDLASIASSAQGYYMKPSMLGGGGNEFTDASWTNIGAIPCNLEQDDGTAYNNCVNENGTYVMGTGGGTSLTVTAYPSSDENYTADGTSSAKITATIEADKMSLTDLTTD